MKILFTVLLVALFFWKGEAVTFTVFYKCKGFLLDFTAFETDGKLKGVYASSKYTSCGSHSTSTDKVTFTVPTDGATKSNRAIGEVKATDAEQTACGLSGADSRTLTLILLQEAGIITNGDQKADITCGKDDDHIVDQKASISSISDGLTAVTPTKGVQGVELVVVVSPTGDTVLHSAAAPSGDIALGDSLMIIARLDISSGANDKVLIQTCTAVPKDKNEPIVKVITASCPDTSNGVYPANIVKQIGHKDTDNNRFIVKTPPFGAFRIPDEAAAIDIKCTVLFCASGNGCGIADCTSDGRRRRAAVPTSGLRNQTMSTTIYIGTHARDQDTSALTQGISLGDCLSHVSFISVVAILAVLLVVSLAISVFFCSKLIRQNNNNQQKEAYPSPGYKA